VAIAIAVAVAVLAAIGFAVGGDDKTDESPTGPTAPSTTAPPATAPATSESVGTAPDAGGAGTTMPPATASSAELVLEDGRHAVYLTDLDVDGRTVEVDVIQFLTGDEAIAAWNEAHPDDPGGPPNDYVIVNQNPRLRQLPVADTVRVTVPDFEGGLHAREIAFADLPARLAGNPMPGQGRIWPNPFWLTVVDDTVTAMDEQYIP
jgi:hypothetical protein